MNVPIAKAKAKATPYFFFLKVHIKEETITTKIKI